MRGVCPVLVRLLITGMLVLAMALGAIAPASAGAGTETMDVHVASCCEDGGALAPATCETPCLCLQALSGILPEVEERRAEGFPAPGTRRLADTGRYPDPLPPKSPAA